MESHSMEAGLPVKTVTKTETIKQLILRDIRSGLYRAGDALPSVRDMARRYQVSKSTITQALSNLNELRIVEVEQGKTTRIRNRPRCGHLEIIYSGLASIATQDFWGEFYGGFAAAANEHGGFTYRHSTMVDIGGVYRFDAYDPAAIGGVLVFGNAAPAFFEGILKFGVPVLSVYDYPDGFDVPSLSADFSGVAEDIARRFAQRGCRRVALLNRRELLSGEPSQGVNRRKLESLRGALLGNGVMPDPARVLESRMPGDDGYVLFKRFVKERGVPDGLVINTDDIALGVYRAARELGIGIPDDMPVVGCDNLRDSRYMIPSLSTIEVRREVLGRLAFQRMAACLDEGKPLVAERLPAELVVRESFS